MKTMPTYREVPRMAMKRTSPATHSECSAPALENGDVAHMGYLTHPATRVAWNTTAGAKQQRWPPPSRNVFI